MEISEILEKLPPAPADIEKWIRREVIKEAYIIYNKKENRAVCTRCGHTFRADRFRMEHGSKGTCPKCKSEATYKVSGRGRKNCTEFFRVLLLTHKGKAVYGTLWEMEADFSSFGLPKLSKWPSAIYLFTEKEQVYYKHDPWAYRPEEWKKKKKVNLPYPPAGLFGNSAFHTTAIYKKNLESVFTKSCLKYFWDEVFLKRMDLTAYGYIEYINLSLKYQSLELLRKAGFENLVEEKIIGKNYEHPEMKAQINWRGKSLEKILKLPKRHIRRLRKVDPDHRDLGIFQSLSEKEKRMPDRFMQIIYRESYYIKDIRKHTTLLKWCDYHEACGKTFTARDWLDYLETAEKLGMDIKRNSILFPKIFWEAHDQAVNDLKAENRKELDKKIKECTVDMNFEKNGLVAMMARSQTALNMESAELMHCVKQYGKRIIEGRCYIFFIRKTEEPETPYYTLESSMAGSVMQCRGHKNCSMTDEVREFVEGFAKELPALLEGTEKERSMA